MSTYLIGDVQGCYNELRDLLDKIQFDPTRDSLGFAGDIVNRGPDSLETIRFIKSLPNKYVVLGNHDIYCLILGYDLVARDKYQHTLHDILDAPDKIELLDWLRQQPILHSENNFTLVHAGVPPQWSLTQAQHYAEEVHTQLRGDYFKAFLNNVFGDKPYCWNENLTGIERWRYIINALTRMRFCRENGELEFDLSDPKAHKHDFAPWFTWRDAGRDKNEIYFGHWAALNGKCAQKNIFALDTGCAWGHELTAMRVEDQMRFSVRYRAGV